MEKVRGQNHTTKASFTRPADTTAYTANDVMSDSTTVPTILTFNRASMEGDGASGGGGIIQEAIMTSSAGQATKPDLELWLFDTAPAAENDNAACSLSDAEVLACVGIIPFPVANWKQANATAGAGGNAACDAQNIGLPFNLIGTNNAALFGMLIVRNAYTPVSGESFQIRLKILD